MSDISLGSLRTFATAPARAASRPHPWGVPGTLLWGAAGIGAIFLYATANEMWRAWSGSPIALPPTFALFVQPLLDVLVIAMVVVAVRQTGCRVSEYLGLVRPRVGDVLRGIGWGIVGWIAIALVAGIFMAVMMLLGKAPAAPASLPSVAALLGGVDKWAFLLSIWILMVIVAPVAEELLFRGFLYRGLVDTRLGSFGAILLTSVVFGLIHKYGFGWERVVATAFLGLLLGWLRHRTGATNVPIVAHATANVIAASILTIGILVLP
jgi:CAAX protease family protein